MLLRRVIGDVLRARRQGQHRTLREVSTAANVSLGYLSEIERGQKEASSELLAAICDALGSQLSDVLRDASDSLALAEGLPLTEAGLTEAGFTEAGFTEAGFTEAGLTGRAATDAAGDEPALQTAGPAPREPVLVPAEREPAAAERATSQAAASAAPATADAQARTQVPAAAGQGSGRTITDGTVSVSVRHDGPFRTTLHAVRTGPGPRTRELARPGA